MRRAVIAVAAAIVVTLGPPIAAQAPVPACATWQECRAQALDALERHEYEAFHDLAWRALQKGPKNDARLMELLARAQTLSGRPLDALVMLERLVQRGVVTDAATSDDFRRVRAVPGWAELERRIAEAAAPTPLTSVPAAAPASPVSAAAAVAVPPPDPSASRQPLGGPEPRVSASASPSPGRAPRARSSRAAPLPAASLSALPAPSSPVAAPVPPPVAADAPLAGDAAEALRFTTLPFTPAGLAYDPVSDRFIVGDRDARKLTVVDEASRRVANLAAAQSAGFGDIGAFEIDPREGDLWVVSSPGVAGAVSAAPEQGALATLHKLQLISGRVLYAMTVDDALGPARFADVAVLPRGAVLVLDSAGGRLFVAQPKSRRLDFALQLDVMEPASVAPESDSVVYVAYGGGILRADLAARRARPVTAPGSVRLSGFTRLRWHRGRLVGVQAASDGTYRIVRLRLDGSGQRVISAEVLDRSLRMTDPTAAALSADVLYYLAESAAVSEPGAQAETIIRRVTVR